MLEPLLRPFLRAIGVFWIAPWIASALLLFAFPTAALERTKPPADWALAGIQYQLWAYQVDFIGMPIQMPVREFSNCVDRERASKCSFDDPNSPCKVTMLERVGNTQKALMNCPDMKGMADFVWAADGTSWSGSFQMEGKQIPPGVGMRVSAKYLRPCAEKDVRR